MKLLTTKPGDTSLSPIQAMHTRFEAAQLEYDLIDFAQMTARKAGDAGDTAESIRSVSLDTGRRRSGLESDALRRAILYQVPITWTDALILQYHIWCEADLVLASDTEGDSDATEPFNCALDAIFDFMAAELPDDHEKLGAEFKRATMLAWERRRYRTGLVED